MFEFDEAVDLDRENPVNQNNSEFSQINIDLENRKENISIQAPEIEKEVQSIPVPQNENINREEQNKFENIHKSNLQDGKFQTLDESYSDTFVKYYINIRKEISSEF